MYFEKDTNTVQRPKSKQNRNVLEWSRVTPFDDKGATSCHNQNTFK